MDYVLKMRVKIAYRLCVSLNVMYYAYLTLRELMLLNHDLIRSHLDQLLLSLLYKMHTALALTG